MMTAAPAGWAVRSATFALWLAAAGSAAFWGLRLSADPAPPRVPLAPARAGVPIDAQAIAAMLGGSASPAAPGRAAPAAPPLASRFRLVGVAAAPSGGGAAVIAVDGRAARPYRVGSAVDEGLVLLAVHGRQALIGPPGGPPAVTLELPPLPK